MVLHQQPFGKNDNVKERVVGRHCQEPQAVVEPELGVILVTVQQRMLGKQLRETAVPNGMMVA